MALPTMVDEQINGSSTGSLARADLLPNGLSFSDGTVTTNTIPQYTAKILASPTIGVGNVTCNLATDTLLYRPDGGIWDDTEQCWISVDLTNINPTPKK